MEINTPGICSLLHIRFRISPRGEIITQYSKSCEISLNTTDIFQWYHLLSEGKLEIMMTSESQEKKEREVSRIFDSGCQTLATDDPSIP